MRIPDRGFKKSACLPSEIPGLRFDISNSDSQSASRNPKSAVATPQAALTSLRNL